MDDKELISRLNWFYSLEVSQVKFYKAQSSLTGDQYISRILKKFSEIEESHVQNISALIERLGGVPTIIGEVAAEITGKVTGGILGIAGLESQLKFNIMLEKRAMNDYKKLILKTGCKEVFEILWNNLLDEDLHTAWMVNKLKEITEKSPGGV